MNQKKHELWRIGYVVLSIAFISYLVLENGKSSFEDILIDAENGSVEAQRELSFNYEKGVGVEIDKVKSAFWLWRAAKSGDADSQTMLGWYYQYGIGFEKNTSQAIKWLEKAAEQGDVNGQANLGLIFFFGSGVKQNLLLARMWLTISEVNGRAFDKSTRNLIESKMTEDEIKKSDIWAEACMNILKYKNCN
jgi:hypothetical protein